MNVNADSDDTCHLCKQRAVLQLSHIIPRFVFDWLKATSGTGFIRRGNAPNLRVQDGLKIKLLCRECELLFSKWEMSFAEEIFLPFHEERVPKNIRYETWLAKFAASLSWRVLEYFKLDGLQAGFSREIVSIVDQTREAWRKFLLDENQNMGPFEQHMLPLGPIQEIVGNSIPPNINRYFLRTVHADVFHNETYALVYIKLARILFIGFIKVPNRRLWEGTKLYLITGTFQTANKKYSVPGDLGNIIVNSAHQVYGAAKEISEKQRERIDKTYQRDLERYIESETFRAMTYDQALFGDAAFEGLENDRENKS